ncbi:hypothetical protein [Shewanella glacialimarina]|uniref:hypothetical protein n=1 Tax=Shewanella glacialimarina TaxID=2590884 RepID=UPI001CF87DC8|nr:hypothetical protein [Shewanella glacialimarina]UCX05129.1 hypothetical protein FJ709_11845 [Shewanella glacialimarina]
MDSDIELEISFRFLDLSEKQVVILRQVIPESEFGTHFKTKSPTGIVPLSEANISLISLFMEGCSISKEKTDIFISFVSEYDKRIIDVPAYVNQAVVKLGSKLTLSYTIV